MDKFKTCDEADVEEMFLCLPCAEKMKGMKTVKKIVVGGHVKKKGDCEQCCRRRYGYMCKVEFDYDAFNNDKATNRRW